MDYIALQSAGILPFFAQETKQKKQVMELLQL